MDESLVRLLLRQQAPRLSGLSLRRVAVGWDNEIWRLGGTLAVRLARRPSAAELHRNEQTWLPVIAGRLTLPVPEPLVVGIPSPDRPWPWSVVPWFEGDVAAVSPPAPGEAQVLGHFLRALHTAAPDGAPDNPDRNIPLAVRRQSIQASTRHGETPEDLVVRRAASCVVDAGASSPPTPASVWVHGDLHARNVLVDRGRLAAVLDWGDITVGDPSTDLAAVWWLFDPSSHSEFWASYGQVDVATWHRARAWAALFGLSFTTFSLPGSPGTPDLAAREIARTLLRRVVAPQRPFGA